MNKRYPITMMCAACVPWTKDFKFDEAVFRKEVKHLVDHDVKSIYIFGTAGEGYAVNTQVFTQVVKAFIDECGKKSDVMPMVGIISTSMMEMIERIKIARDIGCRDFQIALPCWGALSDDEVFGFFKSICGQFPDCRFIHYNNGSRTKKLCTIDLYVKIAEEVPNLVAAKYSTSNMYEIYKIVTTDCPITFYLVNVGYIYGAMVGECGLLSSFASVDMDLAWKYFHAGQNKEHKTLVDLGSYIIELVKCFSIVDRELIDSAYDKTIERVADPGFSNTLYPPYKGLTEDEFNIVFNKMKTVIGKYKDEY